jgi:hypothetical protein
MRICNLPDYVEGGGRDQIWRPPYRAQKATLLGLVMEADQAEIDRLLTRDLNDPAGGAVDYRCAHPHIVIVFASTEKMSSADPPDSERGFGSEWELSIWCLVADRTAGERLVWYLPYVVTDSGQTACTGREVYGYPKQVGWFDPDYPNIFKPAGAATTISGLAIDNFGPASKAGPLPLVSVTRAAADPNLPPVGLAATVVKELIGMFPGGFSINVDLPVSPSPPPSAAITASGSRPPPGPPSPPPYFKPSLQVRPDRGLRANPIALVAALAENPTLVFLKQFRDVRCPTKACYQAIIEAGISVHPLGATFAALHPSLFSVTVCDWDTHPIASELGLKPAQPLVPHQVFQATLNFDTLTGFEVWRAPT